MAIDFARLAGETAAITLVLRQLLARLPQEEQDEIRSFVAGRLDLLASEPPVQEVAEAAKESLENIFTAVTPEKSE